MFCSTRIFLIGVLAILLSLVSVPAAQPAYAQAERCFPQTGQCISGL